MTRFRCLCEATAISLLWVAAAAAQPQIYWGGDSAEIFRANLDGSGEEFVVDVGQSIQGLEMGADGQKVYWSTSGTGDVGRANASDGSALEILVGGASGNNRGLVIDAMAALVYYTQPATSERIRKVPVTGGSGMALVMADDVSPLVVPWGIDLYLGAGKMYWTEAGGSFRIRRANLDGSSIEDVLPGTTGNPRGFAIDEAAGFMYWGEQSPNRLMRATLDGASPTELVGGLTGPPVDVEIDLPTAKLYWLAGGIIQRSDLDGSNVETVVSSTNTANADGIGIRRVAPVPVLPGSGLALALLALASAGCWILLRSRTT